MEGQKETKKYPDCFKCKYYRVTWDVNQQRGCDFYQFKTSELPSQLVFRQSGIHCQAYDPKPIKK